MKTQSHLLNVVLVVIMLFVFAVDLAAQDVKYLGYIKPGAYIDGQFQSSSGIAVDSSGNVYVVNLFTDNQTRNRIEKFSSSGVYISKWGSRGPGEEQFFANGMSIDHTGGYIYVIDVDHHCIKKFSLSGVLITKWGSLGSGDGQFNYARRITTDRAGNVYVSDSGNGRIQKFTSTGRFIRKWYSQDGWGWSGPCGIATDYVGDVYVVDMDGHRILKFDSTGGFKTKWGSLDTSFGQFDTPNGIAIDAFGIVYVTERNNRVQKFTNVGEFVSAWGKSGLDAGQFSQGAQDIAISNKGIVYVVDGGNQRIQFFGQRLDYFTTGQEGLPLNIAINDISEPVELLIKSRGLTQENTVETSIPFSSVDHEVSFTVPKSLFNDPLGLRWRFVMKNNLGQETISRTIYTYLKYPANAQVIPDIPKGKKTSDYTIVAVPLDLKSPLSKDVFKDLGTYDDRAWRLFSFDGTNYIENPQTISVGKGYWLITKDEQNISPGEGTTIMVTPESPYVLELNAGWNLIGNPYNFTISWDDVLDYNGNPVGVKDLIQYKGGAVEDQMLERYRGAFVKSDSKIDLEIPVINHSSGAGRKRSEHKSSLHENQWAVNLTLDDGEFRNELFGLGMNPEASLENDRFDETSLPLLEGLSSFKLNFLNHQETDLIKDFIPTQENYTWQASITTERGLLIKWDNSYFGASTKQLVFENESEVELVDMRTTTEARVPAGSHLIKFHFGDQNYIDKQVLEKGSRIGSVYPNPVKRSDKILTVSISLPEGTNEVVIDLKDVLGSGAHLSGIGHYKGGRKSIEWQGDFTELPTGMYLLQLKVSDARGVTSVVYKKVVVQ